MNRERFNIFELGWPEPTSYDDNDIVWWKKGNETDGFWFKAECPNREVIELGNTMDEAIDKVIKYIIIDEGVTAKINGEELNNPYKTHSDEWNAWNRGWESYDDE